MIRFYLVPVEVSGNYRGPKYFNWSRDPDPPSLVHVLPPSPVVKDYGDEPLMIVAADVSDGDDAVLAALADVTKFADVLDTALGANLAAMQAALEALKLPANLLTAATTFRQTLRGILGIFMIAGCMQGKGFNIFAGAVTLSTTMSQIPAAPRTALQDCAVSLGFDISSVTGATTVRQLLNLIANQASPAPMMGVTI
jgi:hypothetical protein